LAIDLTSLFAADGPLASAIPGYRARPSQLEMAETILEAIEHEGVAVLEAGTGTGKTVAYLVPALLGGGKVIISTGTKNLQDQLFHRDIPAVRKALKAPVTVALLKGRANYVCHHYLERAQSEARLPSREDAKYLRIIAKSVKATPSGDRAEFPDVPENAGVWQHVTSTRENCLGQDCASYKECYVMAARKDALQADVVVVNHHLFFADVMLRDEGMAELLPACNTVILDEAHQLPETARLFFGKTVAAGQITELARDAQGGGLAHAREAHDWAALTRSLEYAVRDARLVLPETGMRIAHAQLRKRDELDAALRVVLVKLLELKRALESQAERHEELEALMRRTEELETGIEGWLGDWGPTSQEAIAAEENPAIRWVESFGVSFQLHLTPMSVAPLFRAQMLGEKRAWVFTSATLAIKEDFSHYLGEMGLDGIEAVQAQSWASPFDYANQALLYVPQDMPAPTTPEFTEAVVEAALPLIAAANQDGSGGTFMLFTTLRAMNRAHELLTDQLKRRGLDLPLLLQGEGSRTELLERFRKLGNAVLVASQSFWEGVDVKGDALKLVVIDKLPFAPPDDPVLSARIDAMKQQGRNPFMEFQLPHAAIVLKQGAGRLIRDEADRGVLMIGDTRLVEKPYGRRIWQALPPMRRTRISADAERFLSGEIK
jgi:ATP-dependent DNA helicase DinG